MKSNGPLIIGKNSPAVGKCPAVLLCVYDPLRKEYFCSECVALIGHEPPFNAQEYDRLPLTNNKAVV